MRYPCHWCGRHVIEDARLEKCATCLRYKVKPLPPSEYDEVIE